MPTATLATYETELHPDVTAFLRQPHGHVIGGVTVTESAEYLEVVDPGNMQTLCRVPRGTKETVDQAVTAARAALTEGSWARLSPGARAKLLWRLADLIEEKTEVFAQLETLDVGKPIASATAEVAAAVEAFRYMAGWSTKLSGDTLPVGSPGTVHAFTRREPVGVVGQIIPWNFPLVMAAWKLAPALAAGCTSVLKPAEQTPLTAILLAELALEAGLPAGVLNVVIGEGKDVGDALVRHRGIDKIAFTGSTGVGKSIVRMSADDLKSVTLELGGKNSSIVLPDADFSKAVPGVLQAAFGNTGQICTAPSRILVHRDAVDTFGAALAEAASSLTLGHGMNTTVDLGPVVSQRQLDSITAILEEGLNSGGQLLTGGVVPASPGFYLEPTVVTGLGLNSAMTQTEIFGPVVNLIPFDSMDEAVTMANDTPYGLTAQVWTQNVSSVHQLANQLESGTIWVNGKSQDIALPFGGYKESGIGLEKGRQGIEAYTRLKTVVVVL